MHNKEMFMTRMTYVFREKIEVPSTIGGRYEIDHRVILGSGSYGWVYEGKDLQEGVKVAIKVLRPRSADASIRKELLVLKNASHPNIVRLLLYEETPGCHALVLEFCDSDLKRVFDSDEPPQNMELRFCAELLAAVRYLHELKLIHRDIKPDNILIKRVEGSWVVKVTDFGLSKRVHLGGETTSDATAGVGTLLYMAPEIFAAKDREGRLLLRARYSEPSDCWSCGIVLKQIFDHTTGPLPPPIKGMEPLSLRLVKNKYKQKKQIITILIEILV
jgi:serine/threonine protein kinase